MHGSISISRVLFILIYCSFISGTLVHSIMCAVVRERHRNLFWWRPSHILPNWFLSLHKSMYLLPVMTVDDILSILYYLFSSLWYIVIMNHQYIFMEFPLWLVEWEYYLYWGLINDERLIYWLCNQFSLWYE